MSNWEIERLKKELAATKEVVETLRKRFAQMFTRKKNTNGGITRGGGGDATVTAAKDKMKE